MKYQVVFSREAEEDLDRLFEHAFERELNSAAGDLVFRRRGEPALNGRGDTVGPHWIDHEHRYGDCGARGFEAVHTYSVAVPGTRGGGWFAIQPDMARLANSAGQCYCFNRCGRECCSLFPNLRSKVSSRLTASPSPLTAQAF